jgi:hypothetical protein
LNIQTGERKMTKRFLALIAVGAFFILSSGFVKANDQESAIERIVSNPVNYDGKEVVVEGQVKKIKYTTSSSGDPYTLFKLHDGDESTVGVYTKGRVQISEGSKVRVMGKFNKEKRYAIFKFKNVIKAKDVEKTG